MTWLVFEPSDPPGETGAMRLILAVGNGDTGVCGRLGVVAVLVVGVSGVGAGVVGFSGSFAALDFDLSNGFLSARK